MLLARLLHGQRKWWVQGLLELKQVSKLDHKFSLIRHVCLIEHLVSVRGSRAFPEPWKMVKVFFKKVKFFLYCCHWLLWSLLAQIFSLEDILWWVLLEELWILWFIWCWHKPLQSFSQPLICSHFKLVRVGFTMFHSLMKYGVRF